MVKKLSKRFLFMAGGMMIGLIVLFLAVADFYAGSSHVRGRLETALSKELGIPVKIDGLHFSLWSGLVAKGVAVSSPGEPGSGVSSLDVPRISSRIALRPLFAHRLVVEQLVFSEPNLLWVERRETGWRLPLGRRSSRQEAGTLADAGKSQPETLPAPTPAVRSPEPQRKARRGSSGLEFKIRAARMENATLRFVDHEGATVALLEGVSMDCPGGIQQENLSGRLSIRKTTLRNGLSFEEFTTPFAWKGETLTLSPLEARLAGGTVRGAGVVAIGSEHPPFTLDLLFNGVDIRRLQIQLEGDQPDHQTTGTLQGSLDLYGNIGQKQSTAGIGQLRLQNGRMEQLPLLQTIGKALMIDELTQLDLQQAQLDLRAGDGKIYVDSLVLESPNLSLTATGTSSFNGKLNLAARLAVSSKITRQLPDVVEANFQPIPGSERKAIGFNVTGTLSRPKTDLVRILVGQKIESELLNVFRTLTGKSKKKNGDKAPSSSPPPAAEVEQAAETAPGSQPAISPVH